jgi:hypothetical protein
MRSSGVCVGGIPASAFITRTTAGAWKQKCCWICARCIVLDVCVRVVVFAERVCFAIGAFSDGGGGAQQIKIFAFIESRETEQQLYSLY